MRAFTCRLFLLCYSSRRLLHVGSSSPNPNRSQKYSAGLSITTTCLLSSSSHRNINQTTRSREHEEEELVEGEDDEGTGRKRDASDVLRRWGCTEAEVSQIRRRYPAVLRMKLPFLQSKLQILRGLGILGPDLLKIITCRPRFLMGRFLKGPGLDHRLHFLRSNLFFGSGSEYSDSALLLRAILCNPSVLKYDVDRTIRPCIQLYQQLGVRPQDLARLLLTRPTIIPRSSLDEDGEKLDLIRRTRLPAHAPMYKYAVSIIAISRLETIRHKIANLEKFGFTADEVLAGLFARTPNVLTLSVDKVQRNMTYITAIMKLPPSAVLHEPLLLYANLDKLLKPRHLLGLKLQEMGLHPQFSFDGDGDGNGPSLLTAMRMKEPRFLKAFIMCHKEDGVAQALMDFYTSVKESRRLADSSKKIMHKWFPI